MKRLQSFFIIFLLLLTLTACTIIQTEIPPTATAVFNPTSPLPTPTLAPVTIANETPAEPTAVPTQATTTPTEEELIALVSAGLRDDAFERINVLPLTVPNGERPLWAVFSVGFLNFDLDPVPGHFVAIYTQENSQWVEVANQSLHTEPPENDFYGFGPDIIMDESVQQVDLSHNNIWLSVEGGIGAHGGLFQLLRFDGTTLQIETTAGNASPGVSFLEDLNSDGTTELILRQHNYYVFCYACGVRYLSFSVLDWDADSQQLVEQIIQPLPTAVQDHPAYQPNNRAVELAAAGLWLDALVQIEIAEQLARETAVPNHTPTLQWNATLIRLYNQAYQDELEWTPYPLLTNIFYGDYAAALNIVRAVPREQIFSTTSPLIQGTVAEFNEQWLAEYILEQTTAALSVQPNLAAAYYFRAWAAALNNPTDSEIEADLQQAAALEPNEPLYSQIALPAVNRIQFGSGETAATITGQLDAQRVDTHVLTAQAGQLMMVSLITLDENARVSVQDDTGNYLYGQVNTTFWQSELPDSGDYLIRVISGETAVTYTLQIIIPQRISFAPGAISATLLGDVAAHVSDDYILSAAAGQTMTVVIDSPNNNVLLTIVGADGIPLTNGLMSGATNWQGELPATQDYTIRAIGTEAPASYTLTVTIA